MKYLLAIIVVFVFVIVYVILYKFNSKIKIDCDKTVCEGCKILDCIHRNEEDK